MLEATTRYKRIKSMTITEMAQEIIKLNFTDAYCKSDCDNEDNCEREHELECCVKWLEETEEIK